MGVNEELVEGSRLPVRLFGKVNLSSGDTREKAELTTSPMASANMSTRFGCRSVVFVLSKKTREHSSIMISAKS